MSIGVCTFAQNRRAKEITPQLLLQIRAEVEREVPAFKNKLKADDISAGRVEFQIDTFRIQRIADKRMTLDFTTAGMNTTMYAMSDAYDKLMNKYYARLLKLLKPKDKTVLISAQRAWIGYRDAESKLIGLVTDPVYSGGGTIQTNIACGDFTDIIVKRTETIFDYYDSVIKNK
jgi:uncharacterized protein YecT (DUF1311 family)